MTRMFATIADNGLPPNTSDASARGVLAFLAILVVAGLVCLWVDTRGERNR